MEEWKKEKDSNTLNRSSLSLHITANEKMIKASTDLIDGSKEDFSKQIFVDSMSALENPFEFSRQQSNRESEPEVSQFKASQLLLKPNENDKTKKIMGDDPAIIAKRKCLKCDLPAAYYSQNPKQAVYCKQCFINMVHHKFSYVLGKNRIFKDGSSKDVLLVWKDSLPDNFLLETVKTGVNQDVHKRLEAQPQVLVILESAQTEQLKAEYEKALKRKDELNMPWQWNFIHFCEVFKQDIEFIYDEPTIDQGKASVLKYLFGKASAKNDRLEFKRLLTELLIYRAAKALKIEKVMVSDCAEKTAQNSFDALCFGRGSSISQLTAPVDTRFPTVSIIRPLREIYDAEIKLVLRLESSLNDFEEIKLNQVQLKSSKTVQEMNVEFLSKLQASGFPSTLTSVVSTSSKIRAPPNSAAINSCCLCYEKCESIDYCPACDRLLKAIPSFPDELRSFLSTLAK